MYPACTLLVALVSGVMASAAEQQSAPQVISVDFEIDYSESPRLKRRTPIEQTILNDDVQYLVPVQIGTPPQNVTLQFSMSSADTWFNSVNATICQSDPDGCKRSGTFNRTASSTYRFQNDAFNMSFVDGTETSGDWISDTVRVGNVIINGQQLGLANESEYEYGMLGLAYPASSRAGEYPGVLQQMMDQGRIKSRAYSLYLADSWAKSGTVLFGGVDTAKFEGRLEKLAVNPSEHASKFMEPIITLTDINYGSEKILEDGGLSVILSPEATYTFLPPSILNKTLDALNGTFNATEQLCTVPCDVAERYDSPLNFTFKTVTISVPMEELIYNVDNITCVLGLNYTTEENDTPLMGLTFLRSAYIVFDLTHNWISIAQSKVGASSDSNIIEIDNSATAAALTAVASSAKTTSPTPTPSTPARKGLSSGGIAGIAITCVIIILILVAAAMLFIRKRRPAYSKLSGGVDLTINPKGSPSTEIDYTPISELPASSISEVEWKPPPGELDTKDTVAAQSRISHELPA